MANYLTAVFAFVAIFYTLNAASVKDSCPLPSRLKSNYDFDLTKKPYEWVNKEAKTAYLHLVLSWTPTYCATLYESVREKSFQCMNNKTFGLVVHGLWPQAANSASVQDHPRNCRGEKQLDATLIKRFYCITPDEVLLQAEWEKHGTCHYKTAVDYFTITENFYKTLNIPNIKSMINPTATVIKNSFLSLNSKLFSSAIKVTMDAENRLKEIKFCYSLTNQFISCYA